VAQVRALVGEDLPALLITAELAVAWGAAQQLNLPVLAKPLQAQALVAALRQVFERTLP
jgi:hypothetical protein